MNRNVFLWCQILKSDTSLTPPKTAVRSEDLTAQKNHKRYFKMF